MDADFLGRGWAFPIAVDAQSSDFARSGGEAVIAQSIWLILGTAKGERVMRPDFGCDLQDFVFALDTATTAGRIADEVRDALVKWEPRIEVLNVEVGADPARPATLLIDITYEVLATNSAYNLVYPFFLDQGA